MQQLLKTKFYIGEDQRSEVVRQTLRVFGAGVLLGLLLMYLAMRTPTPSSVAPPGGPIAAPPLVSGKPPGVAGDPPDVMEVAPPAPAPAR